MPGEDEVAGEQTEGASRQVVRLHWTESERLGRPAASLTPKMESLRSPESPQLPCVGIVFSIAAQATHYDTSLLPDSGLSVLTLALDLAIETLLQLMQFYSRYT